MTNFVKTRADLSSFAFSARDTRAEIVFDDGGMNLLSSAALREFRQIIEEIPSGTRLLVFRSGRPSLFAAGADMAEMQRFTAWQAYDFSMWGQETFDAIECLPCLTVALIDGDCFGGALDLALAFDVRLATPRSRFAHPGARLGIVTGFGGTSRWRQSLARAAANQMFLANRIVGAEEALAIGLVSRAAASHDQVLARLAAIDPATARLVKEVSRLAPALSRSELLLMSERLGHVYFGARPGEN
jgi:enoyl-CoA hydratase